MPHAADRSGRAPVCARVRDAGVTFIEVLVAIVLLGTVVIATMTALYTSIRGSDQHRNKVNALAELEGAGAFLARAAYESDCSSLPSATDLTTLSNDRPGSVTSGITIEVTDVTCVDGLPQATLTATSTRGDAIETLDVAIGGISVLNPEGSGSDSSPTCTWDNLSANPQAGVNVHTSGAHAGDFKSGATISIRLTFDGPCAGPVTATIVSQGGAVSFTKELGQDPLDPQLLNATLTSDDADWVADTYEVGVPLAVAGTTFVVG